MLTIKNDLVDEILKPLGVKYLYDEKQEKISVVKKISDKWDFIVPSTVQRELGLFSDGDLSCIVNGWESSHSNHNDSTDSCRSVLKKRLQEKNCDLYSEMHEHIHEILQSNAFLREYQKENKCRDNNIKFREVERFCKENDIQEMYERLIEDLGLKLRDKYSVILDDDRLSDEMKLYIDTCIDSDPQRVYEILVFIALFCEKDEDKGFYHVFESNYLDEKDFNSKGEIVKELTNTIISKVETTDVLYREKELQELSDLLRSKKNIVLSGFGGCGKTSIARLLYSSIKGNYDYCGWISYNIDLKQSMISSVKMDDYNDDTMTENDSDKKWEYILKKFADTEGRKLFVIDNVDYIDGIQNPEKDNELKALSGWNNVNVIITSRLDELKGYGESYLVENLGDSEQYENCINLFYHYNKKALAYKEENIEIVHKLCEMASFNTMVIELLAKGSVYDYQCLDEFYEKLKDVGFKYVNEVPVETMHDYNGQGVRENTSDYYDIGNETTASQLIKLFNLRTRSGTERMILWDFHCLPEAERVSRDELKNWMGYTIKDIHQLCREGWIKYADGKFYIHPLIRQAIKCLNADWHIYWNQGEQRREQLQSQETLVNLVKKQQFYNEEDNFDQKYRKIRFTRYLTYGGEPLDPETILYVADCARRSGVRDIGKEYYKAAYDKLQKHLSDEGVLSENFIKLKDSKLPQKPIDIADPLQVRQISVKVPEDLRGEAELFWRCTYYYGYMVSYTISGYDKSAMLLLQAYYIILEIGKADDVESIKRLARTLDHLGYILSNYKKDNCAWVLCAEYFLWTAISIRKKLVDMDKGEDTSALHDLAWSQDNLGNLYAMLDADKMDAPTTIVLEVSPLVSAIIDFDVDAIVLSGSTLIEGLRNRTIYQKAENFLRDALKVREEIALRKGYEQDNEVSWTLCNLARLIIQDKWRYKEAEELILRALYLYEEMDKKFPDQHASSMARTYRVYARLLMQWDGRMNEARECLEKALKLNEKLENDYPGIYIGEIRQIRKDLESLG